MAAVEPERFLQSKFEHLYYSFDQEKKGFLVWKDAELQRHKLLDVLRRQQEEKGAREEEIEQRTKEFTANWLPGAMAYFKEMCRFAKGDPEKITRDEFIAFNMSIREHIRETGALPEWLESSLRMSYPKCWGNDEDGRFGEDGLELLPGVGFGEKGACYARLTDNNNKKISMMEFLALMRDYYSAEDPEHISKYIHGFQ